MVLLIGGLKVDSLPPDSNSLYHMAPHLKDSGSQFISILPKIVGPMNTLYVSQREFAICIPHDKNVSILGTDDCTTCLAIIIRHPSSGAIALGHFESVCVDGISTILNRLQDLTINLGYFDSTPLQMHIVGSFSDTRGYSEELIYSILHYVHKQPIEVELMTACVGELNTILRGDIPWPIIYGVGINLKTGEIFPATFPDKGPDLALRHARLYTGSHSLLEIYEPATGLLRIGPFHYEPMRCALTMLSQSDEFILGHLSSSPEVEPPHVLAQIRSTLKHIQEHPFPEITIFMDNRPRYYRKDENGIWVYCSNVQVQLNNNNSLGMGLGNYKHELLLNSGSAASFLVNASNSMNSASSSGSGSAAATGTSNNSSSNTNSGSSNRFEQLD